MHYMIYNFEIGDIAIGEENGKIVLIDFFRDIKAKKEITNNAKRIETKELLQAYRELKEYFEGKRKVFNIQIELKGTDFQKKVWEELLKIPYGETRSYLDIAKSIGNPKASRAVGMANNRNKIIIVVPCHRVIGSNKKLVGYAGGLDIKEKLLNLEKSNK